MLKKILYGTIWLILTAIGVILMFPYEILQVVTEKIEDILQILEMKILDNNGNKKTEVKKNGRDVEF